VAQAAQESLSNPFGEVRFQRFKRALDWPLSFDSNLLGDERLILILRERREVSIRAQAVAPQEPPQARMRGMAAKDRLGLGREPTSLPEQVFSR
jgi:hypothetical protein